MIFEIFGDDSQGQLDLERNINTVKNEKEHPSGDVILNYTTRDVAFERYSKSSEPDNSTLEIFEGDDSQGQCDLKKNMNTVKDEKGHLSGILMDNEVPYFAVNKTNRVWHTKDERKAFEWYKKSAKPGNSRENVILGSAMNKHGRTKRGKVKYIIVAKNGLIVFYTFGIDMETNSD
ncbi:hypothetical protein C2G38_2189126 [Gigaspora rosea]|uniref:Uncharacterized protein n=1 Tax=Gigaspora rosea TaxID=44941 RepID=A0A397VBQ2_9GLOM|nr:hypothetical protein C2G38_2189126 [Gigaspora rosea]